MLGVEIEFGNNQIRLETSSYKPTKAKTPARTQGFFSFRWWPGAESNHRHKDFQSSALPTELPGHLKGEMILQKGFSRLLARGEGRSGFIMVLFEGLFRLL